MNKILNYWYLFLDRYLSKKWNIRSQNSRIYGKVLMYHHVSDVHININESCQHTIKCFKDTLLKLKSRGYKFISADEMMSIIEAKSSERFAMVTFDDVPENVYTNAYPILKYFNIPFMLFVTYDYLNREGYINTQQLIEMSKDPLCSIGAHTLTHPMLRKAKDQTSEIVLCREKLEDIIGQPVKYIAYPFGKHSSVSKHTKKTARRAGYKCAFGTIDAPVTDLSAKSLFYLPRVVVK